MDVQSERPGCAPIHEGLLYYFKQMPDPRRADNTLHRLVDMIVIAICAVLCGADDWVKVVMFGQCKEKWFSTFLELPHGIPSHDTFGRVFSRINPDAFEACFAAWTGALAADNPSLVAIDGKAIRRSFQHAWDTSGMAHLVSAFVGDNRLVMGQLAVEDKSNEITAIPRLLEFLDIRGATVTIDAIGCQKSIAQKIIDGQGDYLLALKDNQKTPHEKVKVLFKDAILDDFKDMEHDYFKDVDGDHGRIETRQVWTTTEVKWLGQAAEQWPG